MSPSINSTDVSAGSTGDASPTPAVKAARQWPPPSRSFANTPDKARDELAAADPTLPAAADPTLPADAIVTKERVIRQTFEKVKEYCDELLGKPNKEAIGDYPPESLRVKEARANGGSERFRIFLVWEPNV